MNTYPPFAELGRSLQNLRGRLGMILPSGIATDDTTKFFFQALVETKTLASLYDFENRLKIFPGIDSRIKFCLLTLSGAARPVQAAEFVFFALDPADVRDPEKRFTLSPDDIALLNPNTKTCPVFRTRRDAEITKAIYRRVPVLVNEATGDDPWGIKFMAMFHMSNDSGLFKTLEQLLDEGFTLRGNHSVKTPSPLVGEGRGEGAEVYLPLYEAKLMHQFDHRFATYTDSGDTLDMTPDEKRNPLELPMPRYWVGTQDLNAKLVGRWERQWLCCYRWISNATNERTFICSIVPKAGFGNSAPLILPANFGAIDITGFVANTSSFVFDYATRQKMGGTNMTFGITEQLPVLPPTTYTPTDLHFIVPRVLELTYTA